MLAALKDTFHDDAVLDFNMFKTNILVKGISAQTAHAAGLERETYALLWW